MVANILIRMRMIQIAPGLIVLRSMLRRSVHLDPLIVIVEIE